MDLSTQKIALIDWLIHLQNQQTISFLEKIKRQTETTGKQTLSSFLLDAPTLSDDELQRFEENRKWIDTPTILKANFVI